jgi:hypothetical protein
MKRFSWIAFTLGSLLHLYGSKLLFEEAMRYHLGDAEPMRHATLVKIGAYLWWPAPMLLRPLLNRPGWFPRFNYFPFMVLGWSFIVGATVGFLMPRLLRWLRKSPNHAMQRTAGRSAF